MRTLLTFMICISGVWAAPELIIPDETVAKSNYVIIQPGGTSKSVEYIGLDGVEPFPLGKFGGDKKVFVLPIAGLARDRVYRFVAIGTLNDEQTRKDFVVIIGKKPIEPAPAPTPIPDPPPQPEPIPVPTPVMKGPTFVYFVEATGNAAVIKGHLFDEGQPLRKWQEAGGHKVTALPIDTNDPAYARYVALAKAWIAKGNKLPYLVIFGKDKDGGATLLWEGATPDAPGDILKRLQQHGK